MKILVVSDSHGRDRNIQRAIEQEKPFDMMLHLGDIEEGEGMIRTLCLNQNPTCQMYAVRGNNDFFSQMPAQAVLKLGPHRALLVHGHHFEVHSTLFLLEREARAKGADVALFGHTHVPLLEERDGILFLNPGSISLPRQEGRQPSYGVMEIDGDGEMHCALRYLMV